MSDRQSSFLLIRENKNFTIRRLDRKRYSVGRCPGSDIFLSSKGISRYHATIFFSRSGFWIVDGDLKGYVSTNGILINQKKISVKKLSPFDIITFHSGVNAMFITHKRCFSSADLFQDLLDKIASFTSEEKLENLRLDSADYSGSISQTTHVSSPKNLPLDDLTKLPNRSSFFARVQRSIDFVEHSPSNYAFAVFFIDVDRFKFINDSFGHLVGDKYLICIAQKLESCLREGDMVARLGGDEFAIILDDLRNPKEVLDIAQRLQGSLEKPFNINDHEIYPSLSFGIALSSSGYKTVEDMIRDADIAMYQAKSTGKSKFLIFDKEMHSNSSKNIFLDNDLRRAVHKREFHINYQPIVSIMDQKLIGFEALIRWTHPTLGFISPSVFIPLAEETNLIHQIGYWALDEACRQLSLWKKNLAIQTPLTMNVNISAKQLSESSLIEKLMDTIKKYELEPSDLKLEVTESVLMEGIENAIWLFNQLKQLGFQLAIDDFGTGYSSLSYLNKFPIDTLKVDRSFISQIDNSEENTSMNVTNSIISLAHNLGVKVVAEGIENLYHLTWLKLQRCDYGQGYLFSKPLAAKEATSFAERGLNWIWRC